MIARTSAFFASPRLPWLALVLVCLLASPALFGGLAADDVIQRAKLDQTPLLPGLGAPMQEYFAFIPAERRQAMVDAGILAWWSHPQLRLSFFRPFSVTTHQLDHALWPDLFPLQHAWNLLFFGVLLFLVHRLFLRLSPGAAAAGLATALFALEDNHALPLAWLANRHALITAVAGVVALSLHQRWLRRGGAGRLLAAAAVYALALLCGEAALGALAYVAASQLVLDKRGTCGARLLALAPYLLVTAAWGLLYSSLGHGAVGSGLYLDPLREPFSFALALPERWALMVASQWFQLPVDFWFALPRLHQLVLAVAATAGCGALLLLLLPLLRRDELARFWALGMSLAVVPLCASVPMDRVLLFAGLGACALLACQVRALGWLEGEGGGLRLGRAGALARGLTLILLLAHLLLAPLALILRVASFPLLFGETMAAGSRQAPDDAQLAEQVLVFVNGFDTNTCFSLPFIREHDGGVVPRRTVLLAPALEPNEVQRPDARSLRIKPDGGFLANPADRFARSTDAPFVAGQRLSLPDYEVLVEELNPRGLPASVLFRFREPLDGGQYRWVYWRQGRVEPFPMPQVGGSVRLELSMPTGWGGFGELRE